MLVLNSPSELFLNRVKPLYLPVLIKKFNMNIKLNQMVEFYVAFSTTIYVGYYNMFSYMFNMHVVITGRAHCFHDYIYINEGNDRNEIGHWTNDEIGVAVQSWLWVQVGSSVVHI